MSKERGFTLIEILVALAVFAILATLTSSAMYYAFNTKERVSEQAERLNTLQLALTLVQRDIEQIIPREVRGNEMQVFSTFIGETQYVEFTRSGFPNPKNEEKRSTLKRIALLCKDNKLIRRSWAELDTINRKRYRDKILIEGVLHCKFGYLNSSLQVLSEWRANAIQQNQHAEPLPKAIQFNFTLQDWDKISLLFIIPEGLYAENQV